MNKRKNTFDEAVSLVKRGEPVIFPTDTVYGLGVSVHATEGPDALYCLKERDRGKPIAWLIGDFSDLERYGCDVPDWARDAAEAFWPGPLTLIVRASEQVPPAFCSDAGTVGLRMPDNETARALIREIGAPLATTSANMSGNESSPSFDALDPALIARVRAIVPDEVDDGKSGVASTVVDCTGVSPLIVRSGAISLADILGV